MAARDRIRLWQASLRTFYLMEVPLLQFRLLGDPKRISPAFRNIEARFLVACSGSLNRIADCLEHQLRKEPFPQEAHDSLQKILADAQSGQNTPVSPHEEGLLRLSRILSSLIDKLEQEAAAKPIFATE